MRSIERTLLAWILSALALGGVLIALVTYVVTLEEMHESFDADLKNVARAVSAHHHAGQGPGLTKNEPASSQPAGPDDAEIVTLIWTPEGDLVFASDPRIKLPFSRQEGLSRPMVQGEAWIVYTAVSGAGVAQAAQRVAGRSETAGESAANVFPPLIGMVLAVGALLVFGLRRGLQPLDDAAQDIAKRSAQALEPITLDETPKEIAPLVQSINGLMSRLAQAFGAQRRFLADAAHELRTPLTALRLQLQLLERTTDESERRQAMVELAQGIDRSQHLIEQLLQVARAEPDGEATRRQPVDLSALVLNVVAALSPKADQLNLDLGADAAAPTWVLGDPEQLSVLLSNLVENALRYTPAGGVIDVAAGLHEDGSPRLRVLDTGPGIPAEERSRVFDRFYRTDSAREQARDGCGSGLGLSIVKAIAERHDATVALKDRPDGVPGLWVEVRFLRPAAGLGAGAS